MMHLQPMYRELSDNLSNPNRNHHLDEIYEFIEYAASYTPESIITNCGLILKSGRLSAYEKEVRVVRGMTILKRGLSETTADFLIEDLAFLNIDLKSITNDLIKIIVKVNDISAIEKWVSVCRQINDNILLSNLNSNSKKLINLIISGASSLESKLNSLVSYVSNGFNDSVFLESALTALIKKHNVASVSALDPNFLFKFKSKFVPGQQYYGKNLQAILSMDVKAEYEFTKKTPSFGADELVFHNLTDKEMSSLMQEIDWIKSQNNQKYFIAIEEFTKNHKNLHIRTKAFRKTLSQDLADRKEVFEYLTKSEFEELSSQFIDVKKYLEDQNVHQTLRCKDFVIGNSFSMLLFRVDLAGANSSIERIQRELRTLTPLDN